MFRFVGGEECYEVVEGLNWIVGGMMILVVWLSWDFFVGSLMRRVVDMVYFEFFVCIYCGVVELWERNFLEVWVVVVWDIILVSWLFELENVFGLKVSRFIKLLSLMFNDLF